MIRRLRPPVSSTRQYSLPMRLKMRQIYNKMIRRHLFPQYRRKPWVYFLATVFFILLFIKVSEIQQWDAANENSLLQVQESKAQPVPMDTAAIRIRPNLRPIIEDLGPVPIILRPGFEPKTLELNFTDDGNVGRNFNLFTKYSSISLRYSSFKLELPNMDSEKEKIIFQRNKFVKELLQEPPPEKLRGEINLLQDGIFKEEAYCGYKAEMINFKRHSALSRKARISSNYLVPLAVPESNHFQHFIDGVIPKLMQVSDFLRGSRNVKLLIRSPMNAMITDLLREMHYTPDMIQIFSTEHVRSQVQINTCITPPMHPVLMQKARQMLSVQEIGPPPEERSVLLILRDRKVGKRFLINSDNVTNFLRERYPNRLKVIQDIHSTTIARKIFSNSSIIIGVHGGAFYNILFAPRNTAVVEIVPTKEDGLSSPPKLPITVFWEMAYAIRQTYWRLLEPPQTHLGNVFVDINKLERVLDKIDQG